MASLRFLAAALLAVACAPGGSRDRDSLSDAGATDTGRADAGRADAGSADAGSADAGSADAGSADAGNTDAGPRPLPDVCEGACSIVTLEAKFGTATAAFTRAQFGLTAPAHSTRGVWELYLEAHAGGDAACPTESSPTPDRTLVLSGLVLPSDDTPRTEADGLKAALFDFGGAVTTEPLLRATSVRVTPLALRACGDCATPPAEFFFSFALEAQFPGGTISGTAYATHCASLDER